MSFIDKFYLKSKLSSNLVALYTNRTILAVANGLLALFLPIFIYIRFSESIQVVLFFYLIGFFLYTLLVAPGAMIMSKIGMRETMILAIPFLFLYFLFFYYFDSNPILYFFLAIVAVTFYRFLYWIPYHTEFAEFTDKINRGKQVGFLGAVYSLLSIVVPITAGFIISRFNFQVLFVMVMILIALSIFPLFLVKRVKEKFTYGYLETFTRLFSRKNRRILLAYAADGAEAMVGLIIWPIFIFKLLKGEFLEVGAISSVIILATVVLNLITGDLTDRFPKKRVMGVGTVVYAAGWFLKTFVETAFQIFVVGSFHSFAAVVRRTPFDALMYERAADQGHYVDEYSVLREAALNIGRFTMLLLLMVLLSYTGLNVTFLVAAVISLLINVL